MPAMPMADPRRGVAQEILIAYPAACAELRPLRSAAAARAKLCFGRVRHIFPYGRRLLDPVVLKGF